MPKEFRLESKNLFLTFPQTTYPLEDFKANCLKLFESEGIEKLLISTEKHQDGNDHIHAVICLQKQLETQKQSYFDGLVQPPRHPSHDRQLQRGFSKDLVLCDEGRELDLTSGGLQSDDSDPEVVEQKHTPYHYTSV